MVPGGNPNVGCIGADQFAGEREAGCLAGLGGCLVDHGLAKGVVEAQPRQGVQRVYGKPGRQVRRAGVGEADVVQR